MGYFFGSVTKPCLSAWCTAKPNARFAVEGLFVKQPTEGWEDKPQIYFPKDKGLGYSWDKAEVWWKAIGDKRKVLWSTFCTGTTKLRKLAFIVQKMTVSALRMKLLSLWCQMSSSRHSCISRWRVFIGCSSNQTQPASSKSQKTTWAKHCLQVSVKTVSLISEDRLLLLLING